MAQLRPDIPIVLCTGYDPTSSYGEDGTGQIADYITELAIKPLERHELVAILRRVFGNRANRGDS
jgi:DNA-binding NtrC family response regulator